MPILTIMTHSNKIAFQSRADHLQGYRHAFCFCDLDLDQMTLTYENDLDILKTYWNTRNELSSSKLSKVRILKTERDTQTNTAFIG